MAGVDRRPEGDISRMSLPFELKVESQKDGTMLSISVSPSRPRELWLIASAEDILGVGDQRELLAYAVEGAEALGVPTLVWPASGAGPIDLLRLKDPDYLQRTLGRLKGVGSVLSPLLAQLEQRRQSVQPGWAALVFVGRPPLDAAAYTDDLASSPGLRPFHWYEQGTPPLLNCIAHAVSLNSPIAGNPWSGLIDGTLWAKWYERLTVAASLLPADRSIHHLGPVPKNERVLADLTEIPTTAQPAALSAELNKGVDQPSALVLRGTRRNQDNIVRASNSEQPVDAYIQEWPGYSHGAPVNESLRHWGRSISRIDFEPDTRAKLERAGPKFLPGHRDMPDGSGVIEVRAPVRIAAIPVLWGSAAEWVYSGRYDEERFWADGGYKDRNEGLAFLTRVANGAARELSPVVNITWYEAAALVKHLGGRLALD